MVQVLTTAAEVQTFRAANLNAASLMAMLRPGGRFLLNVPPGVGKTTLALSMVNHVDRRKTFPRVAFVVGRHDLITDIRKGIRPDLSVEIYPGLQSAVCNPTKDDVLTNYIGRGMTKLAEADICRPCSQFKSCPFARRLKKDVYRAAEVVFLTDALIRLRPTVLSDWGFGPSSLIIFDEVRGADEGFIHTFTETELDAEIEAAQACDQQIIASFLRFLRSCPECRPDYIQAEVDALHHAVAYQKAGSQIVGFRNVIQTAIAYSKQPLWFESGTYAVAKHLTLPGTILFLGGYLTSEFVASRYA